MTKSMFQIAITTVFLFILCIYVDGQIPTPKSVFSPKDKIKIGSFNIQVFGKTKAAKKEVMEILATTIRHYDIIAIQEIRDKTGLAIIELLNLVNSKGAAYSVEIGPRQGRTRVKEQTAFFYNNSVQMIGKPLTYPEPDNKDQFHREPFMARFSVGEMDITLITVHIDPEEAKEEIENLKHVFAYAKYTFPRENDFMVLGDLNADCRYYDENLRNPIPGMWWFISDAVDTTLSKTDCTYDRIIATPSIGVGYDIVSGIHRFDIEHKLTYQEALRVSDHYPVFIDFNRTKTNNQGDF